mgnify:FL=1
MLFFPLAEGVAPGNILGKFRELSKKNQKNTHYYYHYAYICIAKTSFCIII